LNNFEIARMRLQNLLVGRSVVHSPGDLVEYLTAVQAQDYFGSKWSLGLRLSGSKDVDIESSMTNGSILRTHLLRPTWHFVAPSDIRWLLKLTAPRVQSVAAFMYRKLELDFAILNRSNTIMEKVLHGGRHLDRDEIHTALTNAGITLDKKMQLIYFLMFAELEGLICSGPRKGKQFTYALLEERVPNVNPISRDEGLTKLANRFFISRGPVSVYDFAKWSGLTLADSRNGLDAVKRDLEKEIINETEYWFSPAVEFDPSNTPVVFLLSIFDEYISSYKDHFAIRDDATGARLAALGNGLTYIIVLNGQIVGTWKRTVGKTTVNIKTNLYTSLKSDEYAALIAAVNQYGEFLQLAPILD
jgi:hypothetical protein